MPQKKNRRKEIQRLRRQLEKGVRIPNRIEPLPQASPLPRGDMAMAVSMAFGVPLRIMGVDRARDDEESS